MPTTLGIKIIRNRTFSLLHVSLCKSTHAIQLNEYETDRYFLKNFQCALMLIYMFCMTCEPGIVLQECKSKQKQFQVHNFYKTREKSNKLLYCFGKFEENMELSCIHSINNFSRVYRDSSVSVY